MVSSITHYPKDKVVTNITQRILIRVVDNVTHFITLFEGGVVDNVTRFITLFEEGGQ